MMNFSKSSLLNLNSIEEIEQNMKNFNINSKKNLIHYYNITTSQTCDNENPLEQCSNICTRSYVSSTEIDLPKVSFSLSLSFLFSLSNIYKSKLLHKQYFNYTLYI